MVERANEGLRARKKRAARAGIAAAAHRLFAERGFDAVTVTEIAAAADVSEKTVFNHFATKEDLAFAGREVRLERLVTAIARRPAGTAVLDVFRAETHAAIDDLAGAGLAPVIGASRALRERLAAGWEDETAAVITAIAEATAADAGDPLPAVAARALAAAHRAVLLAALEDGRERADLHRLADRAYDGLAAGLGGYGRSSRPSALT